MERQAKDGTFYRQVGQDEWEPVTRQAKDGTTYKKVGQDSWEAFEIPSQTPKPEKGFWTSAGESLIDGVSAVGEFVDSYGGAPTRSAIRATQEGENPFSAFYNQFGEDPSLAPTGQEIAENFGVPNEDMEATPQQRMLPSGAMLRPYKTNPSKVVGTAIDIAADPLNVVPVGAVAKGIKGTGRAAKSARNVLRSTQKIDASQVQAANATADAGAAARASMSGGGLEAEQTGKLFNYKKPETLDELRNWKPQGKQGQLVGKERLAEIEKAVPDLQTKPLKYHYDMMENPKAMKDLKLTFENLPTKDAKKIAAYNQSMVDESADKIAETVKQISGGNTPKSMTEAGDDFIGTIKEIYDSERTALAPAFERLAKTRRKVSPEESQGLIVAIGENTRLRNLLRQSDETGRISLAKNTPRSGISDQEHRVLSQVIDDLNDGMSFEELQKTREFLRKQTDPLNPAATSEINNVRSIMLSQMEELAAKNGPEVHGTFKSYAQNERLRENVEKIIGGKIEAIDSVYSANPDRVVKRIFSNPNYAETVRKYVGPEKFNDMVGAYINNGLEKAYDSARGFSPSKARNWINKNSEFIAKYASPETQKRLSSLADYGYYGKRFLDEVNPSGTAASLKAMLEPASFSQKIRQEGLRGAVASETFGRATSLVKQKQAVKSLQKALGETSDKETNKVLELINYRLNQVDEAAKKLPDSRQANLTVRLGSSPDPLRASGADSREKDDPPRLRAKGKTKWVADGFMKLRNKDKKGVLSQEELIKIALTTKKGRNLLAQASSVRSEKSLNRILEKLKELEAN